MTKPLALTDLKKNAQDVSALMKILSHANRLLVACTLTQGEKNVSEIEQATGVPQPHLSRDLARLRDAKLVITRRASKNIYYSLADDRLVRLVDALCDAFGQDAKRNRKANVK